MISGEESDYYTAVEMTILGRSGSRLISTRNVLPSPIYIYIL